MRPISTLQVSSDSVTQRPIGSSKKYRTMTTLEPNIGVQSLPSPADLQSRYRPQLADRTQICTHAPFFQRFKGWCRGRPGPCLHTTWHNELRSSAAAAGRLHIAQSAVHQIEDDFLRDEWVSINFCKAFRANREPCANDASYRCSELSCCKMHRRFHWSSLILMTGTLMILVTSVERIFEK